MHTEQSISHSWSEDCPAISGLEEILVEIEKIDPDSTEYEKVIREGVIFADLLDAEGIRALEDSVLIACAKSEFCNDPSLRAAYFICFEWYHRKELDIPTRLEHWRRLLHFGADFYSASALYSYAMSRFEYYSGDSIAALDQARIAAQRAPVHFGFMNNYVESLLAVYEERRLSGSTDADDISDDTELEEALEKYDLIPEDGYYPSFHVSHGRILACLGRYEEALTDYDSARALANKMYSQHHPRMNSESEYVTEMAKITNARATCYLLRNIVSLRESMNDERSRQKESVDNLQSSIVELENRLNSERVNMIEFLGFFAGIISFIVASIQIGSDMSFLARAFLLIVMLGSLLVAFGALGTIVDPSFPSRECGNSVSATVRAVFCGKSGVAIFVGLGLIALGVIFYVLFRQSA